MKTQIIIAVSVILLMICLIPATVEIRTQTVTPPQIEMYFSAYDDAGTLDYAGEDDYDYVYRGSGLIFIYIEFYVPNIFELILSRNGELVKFWSSGIFENDTVEYVWDTNIGGPGIHRWVFVAFNFAQLVVVNSTVDVKIEQGFLTPKRVFFGFIMLSLFLVAIAWYVNQRNKGLRQNRK